MKHRFITCNGFRFYLFDYLTSVDYKYILRTWNPFKNDWVEFKYGNTQGKCNSKKEAYNIIFAYINLYETYGY